MHLDRVHHHHCSSDRPNQVRSPSQSQEVGNRSMTRGEMNDKPNEKKVTKQAMSIRGNAINCIILHCKGLWQALGHPHDGSDLKAVILGRYLDCKVWPLLIPGSPVTSDRCSILRQAFHPLPPDGQLMCVCVIQTRSESRVNEIWTERAVS